jgi:hypothetical protein
MQYKGTNFDQGRKMAALTDGTSKVALVAETKERLMSAWYDGTTNWLMASRHGNDSPSAVSTNVTGAQGGPAQVATTAGQATVNGVPVPIGRLIVGTNGQANSTTGYGHGLNVGPSTAFAGTRYLPTGAVTNPNLAGATPNYRAWGPSSDHAGGIVNHLFGDGHVDGINDGIEPNVYLWVVSRNGGEPQNY